jgi:hypothetical protein
MTPTRIYFLIKQQQKLGQNKKKINNNCIISEEDELMNTNLSNEEWSDS